MYKLIIYKEAQPWLKLDLPRAVKLAELFNTPPIPGGSFCVALVEKDLEIERTEMYDEYMMNQNIDALLDYLLDNGQEKEAKKLAAKVDALTGHSKKNSWAFRLCLLLIGFSVLHILYRTILSFSHKGPMIPMIIVLNLLLAMLMIGGISLFIVKQRKRNA